MEKHPEVPVHEHPSPRVVGPLETAWARTFDTGQASGERARQALRDVVLTRRNPLVTDDPEDTQSCLYTWVVEAPGAHRVLLWANALFDHSDPASSEFTNLAGSNLWTLTFRLSSSWRTSYRIAVWSQPGEPPWRTAQGRHAIRRAALDAGAPDARGGEIIEPKPGMAASTAAGPSAPADPWSQAQGSRAVHAEQTSARRGHVTEMDFPAGPTFSPQRVWLYAPPQAPEFHLPGAITTPRAAAADVVDPTTVATPTPTTIPSTGGTASAPSTGRTAPTPPTATTPLLVLFDGQVWAHGLDLPRLLDAAINEGTLPLLHVAMVDSHGEAQRWEELGVPQGQVSFVLDVLLPRLRAELPVDPTGASTLVAGQSFGGLAALWTLAQAGGQVGIALAQSPSLWRFDLSEPLLEGPGWSCARIRSGSLEGTMWRDARDLADTLVGDRRLGGRRVDVAQVQGGHDWAWWRQDLLAGLVEVLGPDDSPS